MEDSGLGNIAFWGLIFILLFIILILYAKKQDEKKYINKGCYKKTKEIGIYKEEGWECKDGCFYYKVKNGTICFKN